jgi:ribosome-associated protein
MLEPLQVAPGVTIPANDLSWTAVRSSGPGGQNVNKVASKVELRFDLRATMALRPEAKARLRALARNRLDQEGRVRIVSQRTRDQARNLEDAREKLAELVREALRPEIPRRPTRPTLGSRRRRVEAKQQLARKKQLRARVSFDD